MNYLAIDLGAESGRLIVGSLKNGRVTLEEIHRVSNGATQRGPALLWDMEKLWTGVLDGLKKVAARNLPLASLSTDSWGVDYVLNGDLAQVFHYRDPRGKKGVEKMLTFVAWAQIFAETGIQFMPINTLFQLAAETRPWPGTGLILSVADQFNHLLGGEAVMEESMASTFQLYNPRTRSWSRLLREQLNLPASKLPRVVPSGTVIGQLDSRRAGESMRQTKIIATCSHDTGAAVAAAPAQTNTNWAYLSSGTWSLMGVERPPVGSPAKLDPVITEQARELNFTNEIGYGSTIRLLKNISGLWLLQECRRIWAEGAQNFDYAELTERACAAEPFRSLINPMDARFLAPPDMVMAIGNFCGRSGQPIPETPGAVTRCILESLALLYRKTLLELEQLAGGKFEVLHIVGGGSKNALLNQFAADACQIPVLAGPVEATALGNIMIQAITMGEVADLPAARELIRKNFELTPYDPINSDRWAGAFARFQNF